MCSFKLSGSCEDSRGSLSLERAPRTPITGEIVARQARRYLLLAGVKAPRLGSHTIRQQSRPAPRGSGLLSEGRWRLLGPPLAFFRLGSTASSPSTRCASSPSAMGRRSCDRHSAGPSPVHWRRRSRASSLTSVLSGAAISARQRSSGSSRPLPRAAAHPDGVRRDPRGHRRLSTIETASTAAELQPIPGRFAGPLSMAGRSWRNRHIARPRTRATRKQAADSGHPPARSRQASSRAGEPPLRRIWRRAACANLQDDLRRALRSRPSRRRGLQTPRRRCRLGSTAPRDPKVQVRQEPARALRPTAGSAPQQLRQRSSGSTWISARHRPTLFRDARSPAHATDDRKGLLNLPRFDGQFDYAASLFSMSLIA